MDLLATRKDELRIVHQTGERDYNAVRAAYARREIPRGGRALPREHGGTVCLGRLDRLPGGSHHRGGNRRRGPRRHLHSLRAATDSHQLRNAQEMTSAGAGRLIPEPELTAERLTNEIFSLLDQPQEIEKHVDEARAAWRIRTRRATS